MTRSDFLYHAGPERYTPTERTQGPWEVGFQFGGAPAALVAHVVEAVPTLVPMVVARLTIDLIRPVPITPLEVVTQVRREGKRLQVVDVSLLADEVEVVVARAVRMRRADLTGLDLPTGVPRPKPPAVPVYEHIAASSIAAEGMRGTIEYALHPGDRIFDGPTWARLCVPVVAGSTLTSLERVAYIADSCSGVGHPFDLPVTGINSDLTVNVIRECAGEWLCLDGAGWIGSVGVGLAQVRLSDEYGVVAGVSMTRLVDRTRAEETA